MPLGDSPLGKVAAKQSQPNLNSELPAVRMQQKLVI
jgi:hypothetical protein